MSITLAAKGKIVKFTTPVLLLLLFTASKAWSDQADIVFLGDKSRIKLLQSCEPECTAGKLKLSTPLLNAAASEIASLSQNAIHGVIVVDAAQGPLPITREHVLIAKQAGIPSLSIMFVNVSGLEGMKDAKKLLNQEEREVREVFNMYDMGGDKADVFYYEGETLISDQTTNANSYESVLSKLKDIPKRKAVNVSYYKGRSLSTYVYLLSSQEARYTSPLRKGSSIKLWVNGQVQEGLVSSIGLNPGESGKLELVLENPVSVAEGSRYLLENKGQIVAAGVVVRVNS